MGCKKHERMATVYHDIRALAPSGLKKPPLRRMRGNHSWRYFYIILERYYYTKVVVESATFRGYTVVSITTRKHTIIVLHTHPNCRQRRNLCIFSQRPRGSGSIVHSFETSLL